MSDDAEAGIGSRPPESTRGRGKNALGTPAVPAGRQEPLPPAAYAVQPQPPYTDSPFCLGSPLAAVAGLRRQPLGGGRPATAAALPCQPPYDGIRRGPIAAQRQSPSRDDSRAATPHPFFACRTGPARIPPATRPACMANCPLVFIGTRPFASTRGRLVPLLGPSLLSLSFRCRLLSLIRRPFDPVLRRASGYAPLSPNRDPSLRTPTFRRNGSFGP